MTISGIDVVFFQVIPLSSRHFRAQLFWGLINKSQKTDITIPYTTDFDALFFRKKFTTYKLKVSGNIDEDKRLISEACRILKDRIDNFTIAWTGIRVLARRPVSFS